MEGRPEEKSEEEPLEPSILLLEEPLGKPSGETFGEPAERKKAEPERESFAIRMIYVLNAVLVIAIIITLVLIRKEQGGAISTIPRDERLRAPGYVSKETTLEKNIGI